MSKKRKNDDIDFLDTLEETMKEDFDASIFEDDAFLQHQLAMVPTPVLETLVNFIGDNFGECAYNTFMDYFPINANAMMDENPMFGVGGIELVYTKPFKDLIHLMTHLHPDFKNTIDTVINSVSTSVKPPEGAMLQ